MLAMKLEKKFKPKKDGIMNINESVVDQFWVKGFLSNEKLYLFVVSDIINAHIIT